jgi:hypothetical protein
MALQVWKPEFERPGRHFVYTSRYVRMFIELLDKAGDRTNYDALIRKVRKKANDYFDHKGLWQEAYFGYIDVRSPIPSVSYTNGESVITTLGQDTRR